VVVVPSATLLWQNIQPLLLHCCYIATTLFSQKSTPATRPTINAGYSHNTPTTRHHSVDADDDTLLVAVVAVTDADDSTTRTIRGQPKRTTSRRIRSGVKGSTPSSSVHRLSIAIKIKRDGTVPRVNKK
jgi:hypothetical protein